MIERLKDLNKFMKSCEKITKFIIRMLICYFAVLVFCILFLPDKTDKMLSLIDYWAPVAILAEVIEIRKILKK